MKIKLSVDWFEWIQNTVVYLMVLRSEIPSGMCAKLRTVAASNNRDHPTRSLSSSPLASTINCSPGSQALLEVIHQDHSIGISLLLLVRATYIYFCSSRTSRSWWITQSTQHHRRGCNNIPSFLQRTTPIARFLCEGWTPYDLHILVTAPFCCDRKSRAAYVQSFAPWQQATIEFTCHDHSIIACSRHIYAWCCSSRTSRSWWITQSTQHHRRGCKPSTDCLGLITLVAGHCTTYHGERVLVVTRFNITFLPLRLYWDKMCTCFSKDAESLITYGCALWCSQIVCIRTSSLPHFTLWLKARVFRC